MSLQQCRDLQKLGVTFDMKRDGRQKFPEFLRLLNQKFWDVDTDTQNRVSHLRRSVDSFTWAEIDLALRALDAEWVTSNTIEVSEGVKVYGVASPITGAKHDNCTSDHYLPWEDLEKSILRRILGEEGEHIQASLDAFPPLKDLINLAQHNFQFCSLVDLLRKTGEAPESTTVRLYIRTIPGDVLSKLAEYPTTLDSAIRAVELIALREVKLRRALGNQATVASLAPERGVKRSHEPKYMDITDMKEQLLRADKLGDLPHVAAILAGRVPCVHGIANMKRSEFQDFRTKVLAELPECTRSHQVVAAITHLLPKTWVRNTTHTTETRGEWDLDAMKDKESLSRSFEMSRHVAKMRKKTQEDSSSSDEEPETKTDRRSKRKQVASLEDISQVVSSAVAAELSFVAAMRADVKCWHCQGPHVVANCPDLATKDGSEVLFCRYCAKPGHKVGPVKDPECPVLKGTKCQTCSTTGHTSNWCPKNVCKTCGLPGHTSKVCQQRKPGVY